MDRPKIPAQWAEFREWLMVDLTDPERLYVRRSALQWMNRWGQIPFASAYPHSRKIRGKTTSLGSDEDR